jgi:large subunit ribosomal protein L25
MAEVRLRAEKREDAGKGVARRARMAGRVPGVLYGRGLEPVPIEVNRRSLISAFHTDAGMNVLLDLEIDGSTTLAIARELQRDPVRGTLLHADFLKVDRRQEIEAEVPIHIVGEAPGAKEGGVLEHPLFAVHVRAPVTEVPDSIAADVSALGIGDSLRVSDLAAGRAFTILTDSDTVVASVLQPISEEELEALEAGAGIEQEQPETLEEGPAEAPDGDDTSEEPAGE